MKAIKIISEALDQFIEQGILEEHNGMIGLTALGNEKAREWFGERPQPSRETDAETIKLPF